jgi:hypothetical protein
MVKGRSIYGWPSGWLQGVVPPGQVQGSDGEITHSLAITIFRLAGETSIAAALRRAHRRRWAFVVGTLDQPPVMCPAGCSARDR